MPQAESQDRVTVKSILRSPVQPPPRGSDGGARLRPGWVGMGLLALVLLGIGVFVYLPRWVAQAPQTSSPPRTAAAPSAPATSSSQVEAGKIDYLELAQQMQKAEQARGAYEALLGSFAGRGAEQWAGDALSSAQTSGARAQRLFEAREFPAAEDAYKEALADLQQVADTASQLLADQLQLGDRALEQGRSAAAREAFEFALRVEPGNAQATLGLTRAGTVDRVTALTRAGSQAESAARLQAAAQHYQEALELDPHMASAREGLARVRSRIAGDQFATAVSEAMRALAAGEPDQARAAVGRAARIRPDAPELKQALARAAELERQQTILAHRTRGAELERAEQWQAALAEYEAALQLDSTLEFALQGRARVKPRLAIHAQFAALLDRPERLLTPAVRTQARTLLAEARKVAAPGPVLQQQVGQLDAALARAEMPVPVVLKSDRQTQVAINRVAQLGAFEQHRMDLLPGQYVAVGTRQGYRDVRKEFTVWPGKPPDPLTVQCEEPI